MKNFEKALLDLQVIVNNKIPAYNLPVHSGKSIRIGSLIVRNSKRFGYIIIDTATNKSIDTAYSKHGAVALANAHLKNTSVREIKRCDKIIQKNLNDSYFYVNSITKTSDEIKQCILESRLEIAQNNIDYAKIFLDQFILQHIR